MSNFQNFKVYYIGKPLKGLFLVILLIKTNLICSEKIFHSIHKIKCLKVK